jgi:hypothetical protein
MDRSHPGGKGIPTDCFLIISIINARASDAYALSEYSMANVLLKRCTGPVQALRIFSG